MEYIGINDKNKIGSDETIDKTTWHKLRNNINNKIFEIVKKEDKEIGEWYIKIDQSYSYHKLKNKLYEYLYNDVFKNHREQVFKTKDNKTMRFSELYNLKLEEFSNLFEPKNKNEE